MSLGLAIVTLTGVDVTDEEAARKLKLKLTGRVHLFQDSNIASRYSCTGTDKRIHVQTFYRVYKEQVAEVDRVSGSGPAAVSNGAVEGERFIAIPTARIGYAEEIGSPTALRRTICRRAGGGGSPASILDAEDVGVEGGGSPLARPAAVGGAARVNGRPVAVPDEAAEAAKLDETAQAAELIQVMQMPMHEYFGCYSEDQWLSEFSALAGRVSQTPISNECDTTEVMIAEEVHRAIKVRRM